MVIQQMSLGDYADLQARFGVKILQRDGLYWRQVRPFFYRPLLPVEAMTTPSVTPPASWPTGFQYVMDDPQRANSTMNFIMLDDPQAYSLAGLTHKRRQLIKRAAQQFTVRPLNDPRELKERGHQVYRSFFERTRYPYKSDRRDPAVFAQWVDHLFAFPKAILLGGYGPDGLGAISTSYWVNQTLIYSTLICETRCLKKNLGDLMFHEVRQLAARQPQIKEIFVRSYQGGNTLDQYYLLRGCRLTRMPARLEMPAAVQRLLKIFIPRKYELLSAGE